jgi:hypothetical protein
MCLIDIRTKDRVNKRTDIENLYTEFQYSTVLGCEFEQQPVDALTSSLLADWNVNQQSR